MNTLQKPLTKVELIRKINPLIETAFKFFNDSNYLMASQYFSKILEYIEMRSDWDKNDINSFNTIRHYYGSAKYLLGEMFKSIEILSHLVTKNNFESSTSDSKFWSIFLFIKVSLTIPLDIQRAFTLYSQAEHIFSSFDKYRYGLLDCKSCFCYYQGRYKDALSLAQESWALRNNSQYHFRVEDYFSYLIDLAIILDEEKLALKYIKEWESNIKDKSSETKYYLICSKYNRYKKQINASMDLSIKAIGLALETQLNEIFLIFRLRVELIKNYLCHGEIKEAKKILSKLPITIKSKEWGNGRFVTLLVIGDFYLASARHKAGIDPVDDQFEKDLKITQRLINPEATLKYLGRAQKAYMNALPVGLGIDTNLRCTLNQQLIEKRIERIRDIEARL